MAIVFKATTDIPVRGRVHLELVGYHAHFARIDEVAHAIATRDIKMNELIEYTSSRENYDLLPLAEGQTYLGVSVASPNIAP